MMSSYFRPKNWPLIGYSAKTQNKFPLFFHISNFCYFLTQQRLPKVLERLKFIQKRSSEAISFVKYEILVKLDHYFTRILISYMKFSFWVLGPKVLPKTVLGW